MFCGFCLIACWNSEVSTNTFKAVQKRWTAPADSWFWCTVDAWNDRVYSHTHGRASHCNCIHDRGSNLRESQAGQWNHQAKRENAEYNTGNRDVFVMKKLQMYVWKECWVVYFLYVVFWGFSFQRCIMCAPDQRKRNVMEILDAIPSAKVIVFVSQPDEAQELYKVNPQTASSSDFGEVNGQRHSWPNFH